MATISNVWFVIIAIIPAVIWFITGLILAIVFVVLDKKKSTKHVSPDIRQYDQRI